ncbi:MAG: hypothetical protein M3348_13290 [Acidobacteriota bacterium]|nr:hypothetical protein [Acidobacteriota bacterium]
MDIRIEVKADNTGNDAMCAAFLKRGDEKLYAIETLAEALKVSGSTAYKMCESLREYGSGTPSIAAYWFEVLRTRHLKDVEEGRGFSIAEELAFSGVLWVRRLINGSGSHELTREVSDVLTNAADANHRALRKPLSEMSLDEMRLIRERLQHASFAAEKGIAALDRAIAARESSYTGVPIQAERMVKRA